MLPRISPLLRNLPSTSSFSMARSIGRAATLALTPAQTTAAAFFRPRSPSNVAFVHHEASSLSNSSVPRRRFHVLCGREERVSRPPRDVFSTQRGYRKVRRRAEKMKKRELELSVSICIEEALPDDTEISVFMYFKTL